MNFEKIWKNWKHSELFSGVFSVQNEQSVLFQNCSGFRNRSDMLPNKIDTAFGIASGTKLFTGLAICKLLDTGKISLEENLWDILPYSLGQINKKVTIFHLLTHTSGIGDYLDEDSPFSSETELELCAKYPVYLWERLAYYLKMITPLPQKFEPGARFSYSNAGYILLGLAIESISGKSYQQYVADEIISPLNLHHTGFYRLDALPFNSALGYIHDETGQWRTNIYHLPVIGGSDGGIYTCAENLDTLWRAIFGGQLLSKPMLQSFTKAHATISNNKSYGLGVFRINRDSKTLYYAVGKDYGVTFFTVYSPNNKTTVSLLGNTEMNISPLLEEVFSELLH